jgi:hypothetical protein
MNRKSMLIKVLLMGMLSFAGLFAFVDKAGYAATSFASLFPIFPTDYPSPKQTIEWGEILTMEAERNLPIRPPGDYFPMPTSTRLPKIPLQGTPAGSGVIVLDYASTSSDIRRIVALNLSHWVQEKGEDYVTVYVGTLIADRSQGVVYVIRSDNGIPWDKWYETPSKAGGLNIMGAQGDTLILRSNNGTTFYFDVASEKFLSSLSDTAPTVTPFPTNQPKPTNTLTYKDDAPDKPGFVTQNSLANKDLRFLINSAGDEDWFRFYLPADGVIEVELNDLPANYDLYVYSASYSQVSGKSTNNGRENEKVILRDAPIDDYYIRVVGANSGVWSAVIPYKLRFNIIGLNSTATPYPITLTGLRALLLSLNQQGKVDQSAFAALDAHLRSAENKLQQGNKAAALADLNSFIQVAQAQSGTQNGSHLTPEAAAQLIDLANKVRASLQ